VEVLLVVASMLLLLEGVVISKGGVLVLEVQIRQSVGMTSKMVPSDIDWLRE
jgi:hypothetical protein